jgi:soluble lytic murein transglycosylase-like protein
MVILAVLVVAGQAAAGAYVLRPGDTLSGVAARNRVSVAALAQANGIASPDRVFAGTSLRIPGGLATAGTPTAGAGPTTYTIRAGDNLETLARRFGTTTKALAAANGMRDPDMVVIGTKLKLPPPGPPLPAKLRRDPARLALLPRFDYWARAYGVPPDLLKGLAWYESGWQSDVVSSAGAVGIGQLMPFTSDFVSNKLLSLPLDPKQADDNIRMSARFLRFLLDQTGGVPGMAVAAYYQGLIPTRQGKLYDETKRYVSGVTASRGHF